MKPAYNERFCVIAAVTPQIMQCKLAFTTPQEVQWKPQPRKAATRLYANRRQRSRDSWNVTESQTYFDNVGGVFNGKEYRAKIS
jgi:hypothetical protein